MIYANEMNRKIEQMKTGSTWSVIGVGKLSPLLGVLLIYL